MIFMSTYAIGTDKIKSSSADLNVVSQMIKILEQAGNQCQNLGRGPSVVQKNGLKSSSKGTIGIYVVGGNDIGTYVDIKAGLERGYYHYKYVWFAFASWTRNEWITEHDLKNRGVVRAHDDNFSKQSSIAPYLGKSADYFFQQNKSIMNYVYGQSPEELANKILKGGGGSSGSNSSTGSSIKDAIKDVMYGWDGEAELVVRGDTVHIRKIPSPSDASLSIIEGDNVKFESINITDVNPSTPNFITCEFEDKVLTIQDDNLIERFGKIESEVTIDDSVTKLDEAKAFLEREWAKCKRDNGHGLECTVQGESKWKQGVWCRVYLPSFNLDDYMYIIQVSSDENVGEWNTKIKLVDYPPGFGEPTAENTDEDSGEDDYENTEYDGTEVTG